MNELTGLQFKHTFGKSMTDITNVEIDNPINIWEYVKELTENKIVTRIVYERELVEMVYRNDENTFDHILLPTEKDNSYIVIIIDLKKNEIYGHRALDVNIEYS